jgi:light-regulated signal transduction histidine kinase (bacteriophytochrome)
MENFLKYVHPDDRHKIEEGRRLAIEKNIPSVISFRITRPDGEVRHIKSVAKLTDFHDNKVFIGINSDITEQYISNIAMEERNRELEQTNIELASFNHIASHDLQEPLRKIQTFISRIIEKDQQVLSPASQEYFSRIQLSVKRMRNLINDLLLFSRAGKAEKVFKKADLNILLENAQQELVSDIEEKQAVIHSMKLPELNVVPFQIQQLFLNLLNNSIKYSKPGVAPVINIEGEITDAPGNLHHEKSNNKFYKISLTDNGEGFEQEYAENIFMLFYRLHPKSESPGSGIGLAICKKIVENHEGVIFAHSKPGIGSTFTFFLPMNL